MFSKIEIRTEGIFGVSIFCTHRELSFRFIHLSIASKFITGDTRI